MKVAGVYIYPYKGGPGLAVPAAVITPRGFVGDRRYMVVGTDGVFLTQRSHPALGQPRARITDDGFVLHTPSLGDLKISPPTDRPSDERVGVRVWSDEVRALPCGEEADAWFSALLGEPTRLVYMPDDSFRPTDGRPDVPLSFADGYPFLIANTASLEDLNARIPGAPVPMEAFRPSIVIEGAAPWEEDDWGTLHIGEAEFVCLTSCERCAVTTYDPAFPDRPRRDNEPLRTLAKFRRDERNKVLFARNAIATSAGTIRVGAPVSH